MTDQSRTVAEVAAAAARLRVSQQRALLSLDEHPQDRTITFSIRHGYALEKMGLAKRTLLSDRTYLTRLGLTVKAHLEQSS